MLMFLLLFVWFLHRLLGDRRCSTHGLFLLLLFSGRNPSWTCCNNSMLRFYIILWIHGTRAFVQVYCSLSWTLRLAKRFLVLFETFRHFIFLFYQPRCVNNEEIVDIVVVDLTERYLCSILLYIQRNSLTDLLALCWFSSFGFLSLV